MTDITKTGGSPASVAVSATFTAEPIADTLAFWMGKLELPGAVEFAPYNQVFQSLFDPTSLLARNGHGFNVVLVRFEDWVRFRDPAATTSAEEEIERSTDELIAGLRAAAERSAVPWIVGICPSSPQQQSHDAFYGGLADRIAQEVGGLGNVHPFTPADLARLYPVADHYDEAGDRIGHIPFTPEAFAAIGTMVARRIHALTTNPSKVIALDCDNTLWKGIVGEDGAAGVEPFHALQEFMVRQREAGMLLTLCSKNVAEDVDEVFRTRDDMPLRGDHVVLSKVNWNPKSANLREMADELNVGLDSFVFVDDNPVELAEVAAACPQVLTLQTPKDPAEHARFLDHVWAFDHLRITDEDRKRSALYAANAERERARADAPSLRDFIEGLGLDIAIRDMAPTDLPRVSQLTHRTNQFNFTTIRRSESEIERALASGELRCLVARVKDRFGDYGLVGLLLFATDGDALTVDTFLLSCRVLGRGVEYRMLRELGAIARAAGAREVRVPWLPTEKNRPARQFIEAVAAAHREEDGDGFLFRIPAAEAAALEYRPGESVEVDFAQKKKSATQGRVAPSALANEIATSLRDPQQVLAQVVAARTQARPESLGEYVAPKDEVEQTVAAIWQDVLGVRTIGARDSFFDLGGDSLRATQVVTRLRRDFQVDITLERLFGDPTVAGLATAVEEVVLADLEQIAAASE